MDVEDEQMENDAIEWSIERDEQEMLELQSDLSPRQQMVYAVMSHNRTLVHERIYILKAILGHYAYKGDYT